MILHAPGDHRFTILVAEDEPRARAALDVALRDDGHLVIVASNGRQALDMAPGSAPDLVLLDVGACEADGLTALRALRAAGQAAPVVLLTPGATMRGAREAMSLGAYDYIAKPVGIDLVVSVIEEALASLPRVAREAVCVP